MPQAIEITVVLNLWQGESAVDVLRDVQHLLAQDQRIKGRQPAVSAQRIGPRVAV